MALGERIKTLRKEHGWSQADLDNLTDADRDALLHILDGLLANTRIRAALSTAG